MLEYCQSAKIGLNMPEKSIEIMLWKEDGRRCKSSEENAQVFRKHFKKLYELVPMYDKIVVKIVHSRLQPITEKLDHELQCGFRLERGCANAVLTVKQAMERTL